MKAIEFLKQHRVYEDEAIYNSVGEIVGTVSQLMEEYAALRQSAVSGMLPTDEEIINEAEGRYPVKTHNNPDNSPYVGTQKTFIHGVRWALAFVQGNYR